MTVKPPTLITAFGLCILSVLTVAMANAQTGPNTGYEYFIDLDDASGVQLRLLYLGQMVDEEPPPLIFSTRGTAPDPAKFRQFEHPHLLYPPASIRAATRQISHQEMLQLIDALGEVSAVRDSEVAEDPWAAVALLDSSGPGPKVAAAVLDEAETAAVVERIGSAVAGNHDAMGALTSLACAMGSLSSARPVDVTGKVEVRIGGSRLDRSTGHYVAAAILTNTSGTVISGPISLVFTFESPSVSLGNASGTTCGTSPPGLEYLSGSPAKGSLAPGESLELHLVFTNPDRQSLAATTKVLAGPGAR